MDPQVAVALISSGAAVLVALLGIGGTIAAQLFATRRGFDNSLALLERQLAQSNEAAEQERASRERERREQARREDEYRYSEERRILYARFLRLSGAANWARLNLTEARRDPGPDTSEENKEKHTRRLQHWIERDEELGEQLDEATAEVQVIASLEVRAAAEEMLSNHVIGTGTYGRARNKFLIAVHSELGVDREPPWRI